MLMAEHYLKQTTAPAAAPISVAEAKAHMRVDVSDDDTLIGSLIETAVAQLDGYDGTLGGRAMVTQSWTMSTRYALENRIYLPVAPVQSVTSISYYDGDDANQTATVSDYYLHKFEDVAWMYPKSGKSWPSVYDRPDAFRVEFVTGYGAASAVPDDIKTALLLMVAHWYANREPVLTGTISSELPFGIDHIIAKYRLGWSG